MRTVFVNGGSRGIGAAIVRAFAKNGDQVAFSYHASSAEAERLSGETGALSVRADSRSHAEVSHAIEEARRAFGSIDILVNCAGKSEFALVQDIDDDMWHDMMALNLDGYFYYSKDVLPDMLARKKGCIINISSMWGQVGASCEVHYSTSKAAIIGMTRAMAKELGPSGITVNCIAPGVIETDMNARLTKEDLDALKEETPLGRIGTPRDVASLALFLASEEASFMTGQVIAPNGGFVI